MNIHCTPGMTSNNLVADLPGCGTVWFTPRELHFCPYLQVKERCKVTYNSTNLNAFLMHHQDGMMWQFEESESRLYYSNAAIDGNGTILVNIVASNQSNYSDDAYSQAIVA